MTGSPSKNFHALSAAVTGFDDLASELVEARLAQLRAKPDLCPALDALLDAVATEGAEIAIGTRWDDPAFAPSLRCIVLLWYSGGFYAATGNAVADRRSCSFGTDRESGYVSGLAWRTIGAHPMGRSTEGDSYWSQFPQADGRYSGSFVDHD